MDIAAPPHNLQAEFLVIGAGVAGLRAAIELAQTGPVLVVAKDTIHESSSEYAQGGIAAALSDDDEIELHEQDTIAAGDGLCDLQAVRTLVEEAPAAIEELLAWGAEFDREGTRLLFAREGAHSRNRVLHAHGDSTGQEIVRTLYKKACSNKNIRFQTFAAMTDLLLDETGSVVGAAVLDRSGETIEIPARAVLLATGGLGCVYRETTNPPVATGDGVAAAYRAGAVIGDIEFVQFHPTVLHVAGAPRFLLSEALRGEGAYLRNEKGERFMQRYHPLGELAPRDVVSRAIVNEIVETHSEHVYLDVTHIDANELRARFPRIYSTCLQYGIDLAIQPAPVHPAAHYAMGGIMTNSDGQATLLGLFAAGEAACTGVHGANRLASNSLLEGVVYGARAGRAMREIGSAKAPQVRAKVTVPTISRERIRSLAWEKCGIIRNGRELGQALGELDAGFGAGACSSVADFEHRNIHAVASLIARGALAREESRGGHYRTDFPEKRPAFQKHSLISLNTGVRFQ